MAKIENAPGPVAAPNEYLTFRLGTEEYGIDILKVQEIRGYDAVTRIANSPPFIKGVINLRGTIVPIFDLRIKFGLGEPDYDQFTVVVIIKVGRRVVGIVVDSVCDVISLACERIRPAPEFSASLDTGHIVGLGTLEDRMLILIDIEKLVTSPQMALVDEASPETAQQES